ncbi:hypothetical protein B566_EDAN008130, partial [Ephemera danica]
MRRSRALHAGPRSRVRRIYKQRAVIRMQLLNHVHGMAPALHVRGLLLALVIHSADSAGYYGKLVGKLSELHHGVSGTVYAVDARTLHIRDLTYDGEGPDAFFYVGSSKSPSGTDGIRIRDEHGTFNVLKRYRKKHITLTLPEGKTLANIRWFSLWCREFSVNFGDVRIPKGFDYPKPYTLGSLSGIHGVSSDPVVVVDAQTLLVPNFSYDGEAPDAKFWVGAGSKPSPQGIRVADENGSFSPLKKYNRQTLVITLPGTLTVHQIGHFGVWCEAFAVDFAHVVVPPELLVPPSLRILGVSPQKSKSLAEVDQNYPLPSESFPSGNSPNRRSFLQPAAGSPIEQQIRATTYKPDLQDYLGQRSLQPEPVENSQHQQQFHHSNSRPQALAAPSPNFVTFQQSIDQSQFYQRQPASPTGFIQQPPVSFYPHPQQAYYIGQQQQQQQQQPSAATAQFLQYNNPTPNSQYQQQQDQQQYQQQEYNSQTSSIPNPSNSQHFPTYIANPENTYQSSKLNCEVLHENLAFEVRWAVAGDSVVTQLVGKIG